MPLQHRHRRAGPTTLALIADALAAAGGVPNKVLAEPTSATSVGALLGRVQPGCLEIEELWLANRQ